ncbi:hypothetical protein Angca_004124, partial [Angiostrongylus cantonensis]
DSPAVTCGPEAIRIVGRSEDVFEGQVFVKNQRRSTDCFVVYSVEQNSTTPELAVPLDRISACGIDLQRNPSRGLELLAVIVFSFHPSFVTAGDRAFAVHCLFQQHQITVSTQFDFISDLTPKLVTGSAASAPAVNLTVVHGRVPTEEKPAQLVSVGQPLMLVWKLDTFSELYGIRVLDCTAESRRRQRMHIIRNGCSMDSTLISDVRYAEQQLHAYADATAFKFPDLSDVWLKCLVRLCIKRFDHLLVTGKSESDLCRNMAKCNIRNRERRRRTPQSEWNTRQIDDNVIVVTSRMSVSDDDTSTLNYSALASTEPLPSTICVEKNVMAMMSAVSVIVCVSTLLTTASMFYSKIRPNRYNL